MVKKLRMKSEELIFILLTVIVSVGVLALGSILEFDNDVISLMVLMSSVVLIFIIFSISSIRNNFLGIQKNRNELGQLRKDLNISERLSRVEGYFEFEKMKKKGQVDALYLIRIAAIIILGYVILKGIGVF